MSEIITYTPTENLPADERTQSGIYNAIKAWVENMSDIFAIWFNITYADDTYTITFTPKAENIAYWTWGINVQTSQVRITYDYDTSNSYETHSTFTSDVQFHICCDASNFTVGMDKNKVIYSITYGTSFGTNEKKPVVLVVYSSRLYEHVTGTAASYNFSTNYNTVARGLTDKYLIQHLLINNTDVVLDNVFYFDGGLSNPPAGIFKIGSDTYVTLALNACLKL